MKKIDFYRLCYNEKIVKSTGYQLNVIDATGCKITFAIAKSKYNTWDVTEIKSGLKVSTDDFLTRREAVLYCSDSNLIEVVARLLKSKSVQKRIQELAEILYKQCQEAAIC
jgi:hypothetical protein